MNFVYRMLLAAAAMNLTMNLTTMQPSYGAQSEQSEQWLVKNAKLSNVRQLPSDLRVKKEFTLGADHYLVITTTKQPSSSMFSTQRQAMRLASLFRADAAGLDPKIELIDAKVRSEAPPETNPAVATAWHVKFMQYSQLPKGFNGNGTIVAVLDSGVDYTHPALRSQVWTNEKEANGLPGVDDDGNGFVDDVHGYSFASGTGEVMDTYDHGTHCAGLIAAMPQDEKEILSARGVASGARVMAVQIFGASSGGHESEAFLSDAAEAVKYAVNNGAKVLSNSWRIYRDWSGYYNEAGLGLLKDAIKYTNEHGAIFVEAAGNETANVNGDESDPAYNAMYPLNLKGAAIFGVAASTASGTISDFSNFGGSYVHIGAPGSDIVSTIPKNNWTSMSGTSMATPIVAGVIALGVGAGLTPRQSADLLMSTADKSGEWPTLVASGLIDLAAFAKAAQPAELLTQPSRN